MEKKTAPLLTLTWTLALGLMIAAVILSNTFCRIRVLAGSLSIVREEFALCALAGPFNVFTKVIWPKFISELKSIAVIFSHNLLNLLGLQQSSKTLTGQ